MKTQKVTLPRKWFNRGYAQLIMYLRDHPGIDVSDHLVLGNGFELGQWVMQIRSMWQDNLLDTSYILKLEGLGLSPIQEYQSWESMYWYAKDYYIEYGNKAIERNYKTQDGILLGAWIHRQKQYAFLLTKEQKEKLKDIGIEV